MKTLTKLYEAAQPLLDQYGFMCTCNNCDAMIYNDDKQFLDLKKNPVGYCKECRDDLKKGLI